MRVKKLFFRAVPVLALCAGIATVLVSAATAKPTKSIQVCVLLPDTKSSVRWVQFDAPDFATALTAAHVTYSITNALNDAKNIVSQADPCLSRHAKIGVVTAIAPGTSIAAEQKSKEAAGQAIGYAAP